MAYLESWHTGPRLGMVSSATTGPSRRLIVGRLGHPWTGSVFGVAGFLAVPRQFLEAPALHRPYICLFQQWQRGLNEKAGAWAKVL